MIDLAPLKEQVAEALGKAGPEESKTLLSALEAVTSTASPAGWAQRANPAFLIPRHVAVMDEAIVDLVEGNLGTDKLMICMPPRHGKSEMTSKYTPAWFLSRYPDRKVMLCSYEAEFAASWGRKVRDLIKENEWSGVSVKRTSSSAKRFDLEGRDGGMITAGVGGSITGRGAHLLGIDDPVKSAEEARSQTYRDRAYEWYQQTAYTRLEPGGKVMVTLTRWHPDDLGGRLLENEPGQWTVINLPALAEGDDPLGREPGEALWPERYDAAQLALIRSTIGPQAFGALYQQHPTPLEGGLFKRDSLRYYDLKEGVYHCGEQRIDVRDTSRFITVDLAVSTKTRADFTVISVWAVSRTKPGELLWLDMDRRRLEGPDHLDAVVRMRDKWNVDWIGVEKATYGISLLQAGRRAGVAMRELSADKDKVTRAMPAASLVQDGRFWLPRFHPELATFEDELLTFDNGVHDDIVDTFAYAAREISKRRSWARASKPKEPDSLEEQIWKQLQDKRKGARHHPVLGKV